MVACPAELATIRDLERYWAEATFREPKSLPWMQERILLCLLGLGFEQAASYVGGQPDYASFLAWVLATAGPPDANQVARYHAWLDGAPLPPATAERLAVIEAARDVFDADDLAQWDALGFVILRGALSAEEAKACEEVLWQQVGGTPDDPATWYTRRPNGIMVQYFQHPALDVARTAPRVHKAFAQLWGTADLWMTVDRMSFNPPERPGYTFPGPHLHWDVSLAQPIPFATQGILYLTDTRADQGALQLVPGFHHRLPDWLDALGDADPRLVDLSAEAITIPAAAGDLIIWRQDLPHGASPNASDRPRMAHYVNMYAPTLTSHPVWR